MRRAFKLLFLLLLVGVWAWPGPARATKRLAVLVDNSGSMHGRCQRRGLCSDVTGEVMIALEVVLSLIEVYNEDHDDEPVEPVLMLFGGYREDGTEEFREVTLSPGMDLAVALDEGNFVKTDFTMAFERGAAALEGREASYTLFLTDAKDNRTAPSPSAEFTRFGQLSLYGLADEVDSLVAWSEVFGRAKVRRLESGWEIAPSFAEVFCRFLIDEDPNGYLVYRPKEAIRGGVLPLHKISTAPATVYIVLQDGEPLEFERLQLSGTRAPVESASIRHKGRVLVVDLAEGTAPGAYELVLASASTDSIVTTIMMERTELVVMDREHPIGSDLEHKRNEEVRFDLGFVPVLEGQLLSELSADQRSALLELAGIRAEVIDPEGATHYEFDDQAIPSATTLEPGRYELRASWGYDFGSSDPSRLPRSESPTAVFSVSQESGIVLELEVMARDDEHRPETPGHFWQWRAAKIEGRFVEHAGVEIPPELTTTDTITLAHSDGSQVVLTSEGDRYVGSLGTELTPGSYSLDLITPDPSTHGLVVNGGDFSVLPRRRTLRVESTYSNADPEEEGLLGKIGRGMSHVFGTDRQQPTTVVEQLEGPFPVQMPVELQYYDEDEQRIDMSLEFEPLFEDEILERSFAYFGQREYDAQDAYEPSFFGLYRGSPRSIESALRIDLPAEEGSLPGGVLSIELHKISCDWSIDEPLSPKPTVRLTTTIVGRGALEPVEILLDIRSRDYDKEIITTVRGSVLLALLVLALLLLALALLVLLWWRRYKVRRAALWGKLLKLEPSDFLDVFPEKAREALRKETSDDDPARQLRSMIAEQRSHRRELERIRDAFTTGELKNLVRRCHEPQLDRSWKIRGASATLHGTGLGGGATGVRFRHRDLPEHMGSLHVSGLDNDERVINFVASPAIAVGLGDDDLPPPHDEPISLGRSGSFRAGVAVGQYKVQLNISLQESVIVVQTQQYQPDLLPGGDPVP